VCEKGRSGVNSFSRVHVLETVDLASNFGCDSLRPCIWEGPFPRDLPMTHDAV
jgi:hypothetical protein